MQSIFHLHTSELDASFLDALKSLFRDTEITVTVKAASNGHSHDDNAEESTDDETEFLLSHPANRARLLEAINNADAGNLIAVDVEKILAGVHPSEAIITPQAMLEASMREANEGKVVTVDMKKILAGAHPSEAIIAA